MLFDFQKYPHEVYFCFLTDYLFLHYSYVFFCGADDSQNKFAVLLLLHNPLCSFSLEHFGFLPQNSMLKFKMKAAM